MSHVATIQGLYAAFAAGDVPNVLAAFDPKIEWREAESNPYKLDGRAWVGPDAIVENLFAKLAGEWDDFAVDPRSYHDAGDSVVVEGRYTGRFLATERAVDAQFCHVWRLRDGKIASFQQYVDTAQMQRAMGS